MTTIIIKSLSIITSFILTFTKFANLPICHKASVFHMKWKAGGVEGMSRCKLAVKRLIATATKSEKSEYELHIIRRA